VRAEVAQVWSEDPSCGVISALLLRYALGVIPVTRRNVVVK
jgi:hypothetical protein